MDVPKHKKIMSMANTENTIRMNSHAFKNSRQRNRAVTCSLSQSVDETDGLAGGLDGVDGRRAVG